VQLVELGLERKVAHNLVEQAHSVMLSLYSYIDE
jgi:hypothetical protein